MGLLVAKFAQKNSYRPGSHFKFRPLEKNADIFGRDLGANFFFGMVPGTQFHHQITLTKEWSWNWDT